MEGIHFLIKYLQGVLIKVDKSSSYPVRHNSAILSPTAVSAAFPRLRAFRKIDGNIIPGVECRGDPPPPPQPLTTTESIMTLSIFSTNSRMSGPVAGPSAS
jgi:hypothetical protein